MTALRLPMQASQEAKAQAAVAASVAAVEITLEDTAPLHPVAAEQPARANNMVTPAPKKK